MDKKNTIIGVICIGAAFASLYVGQKFSPPPPATPPPVSTAVVKTVDAATGVATGPGVPVANTGPAAFTAVAQPAPDATVTTLQNEYITVNFTNLGGAIRDIALRKFPAELGHPAAYVFNAVHTDPMLAFVDYPGLDRHTGFELVAQTTTEVVYRAVFANQVEVTRRYTLVATPVAKSDDTHDPYQLRHETTFRNLTGQSVPLARLALSLGTTSPISDSVYGQQVSTGYSDGKSQTFIPRTKLDGGSGFLGVGASVTQSSSPAAAQSPGPPSTTSFSSASSRPTRPGSASSAAASSCSPRSPTRTTRPTASPAPRNSTSRRSPPTPR